MKLWMAYVMLGVTVSLLIALAVAGCTYPDPAGPTVSIAGNNAPVTVIIPTGDQSAGGTAPCGAQSQPVGPTGCPSTSTTNNTTNNEAAR